MHQVKEQKIQLQKLTKYLYRNKLIHHIDTFVKAKRPKSEYNIENLHRKKYKSLSKLQENQQKEMLNKALNLRKKVSFSIVDNNQKTKRFTKINPLENSEIDPITPFLRVKKPSFDSSENFVWKRSKTQCRTYNHPIKKKIKLHKLSDLYDIKSIKKNNFFESLENHLLKISNNTRKIGMRITRQHFKKLYNLRYHRQKLTNFFQYENLSQYNQQKSILQTLLSLNYDQVLLLCFQTFDINSDGLISNHDMFLLATFQEQCQNQLVNKDIFRISKFVGNYMKQNTWMKGRRKSLHDILQNDSVFKVQNLTLHKFRLLNISKERDQRKMSQQNSLQSIIKNINTNPQPKALNIPPSISNLYLLHPQTQQKQQLLRQLHKKTNVSAQLNTKIYSFQINFERFKQIFQGIIPQTIYDIIYVISGIKMAHKNYLGMNFDQQKQIQKVVKKSEVNFREIVRDRLQGLRKGSKQIRVERFGKGLTQNIGME